MIQNIQIIFNFNKKKFKIFENTAAAAFPNIVLDDPQRNAGMKTSRLPIPKCRHEDQSPANTQSTMIYCEYTF